MTKETTIQELGDMLSHVVEHMATKEDIADIRNEMASGFADVRREMTVGFGELKDDIAGIRSELADIKQRLEIIEDAVGNLAGYGKEIDYALERIAAIERHLGIQPPVRP